MNEMSVYHTRVLEKGTREEHAFPATRPAAAYKKKKFGKIGWLVGCCWFATKLAWCGGLLHLCVCVCFVCC
jgi:hypothetical protein